MDPICNQITAFRGPYRWLSNFWLTAVQLPDDAQLYPSVEHAYQAAKVANPSYRLPVLMLTPGGAKKWGRRVLIREGWEEEKRDIMLHLLRQKFADGSLLAAKLRHTHPHKLIEENTWGDRYWGVCAGAGQNWLGRLLMQVRDELRERRNSHD